MDPVTSFDSAPRPALVHHVLGRILAARTWEGDATTDLAEQLIDSINPIDAVELGGAVGSAIAPLRGSIDNLKQAMVVIEALDLYEAMPFIVEHLEGGRPPVREPALLAARFAAHPGSLPGLQALIQAGLPYEGLNDTDRTLVHHLTATSKAAREATQPRAEPLRSATFSALPGVGHYGSDPIAPIVYIAPDAGSVHDVFRLMVDLRRVGIRARRLPQRKQTEPRAEWFASWSPIITSGGEGWWSQRQNVRIKPAGNLTRATRRQIVQRVAGHFSLKVAGTLRPESTPLDSHPLDPEVFFGGVLNGRETVFLSGIRRPRLSSISKSHPRLSPRQVRGMYYWDFPQVVGLRVFMFLVSNFGNRRDYPAKAAGFVERAHGEKRTPGAITRDGQILWEESPSVYIDDAGQTVHEALGLQDNVLAKFTVGGSTEISVPALLEPSLHTSVHPNVQRGTPVVKGTRIPATTIARIFREGRLGQLSTNEIEKRVQEMYPSIELPEAQDAARLGGDVLAAS